MYILRLEMLMPGDVVLSRVPTLLSKGIRFAARAEYSHAMLYVGYGSIIHADGAGVHAQNVQRELVRRKDDFRVLRLQEEDPEASGRAIEFARASVGTEYSRIGAIGSVYRSARRRARTNRQFCSKLVAEAYNYAGIKLVPDPSFCSPAALAGATKFLRKVPGCVRQATEAEVSAAKSNSMLVRQQEATNQIMSVARSLTGRDVQTIEQLFAALEDFPDADSKICAAVVESGYLYLWHFDLTANPWRYDLDAFRRISTEPTKKLEVAKFERESSVAEKQRFVQFLIALQSWSPESQSQVRERFIELYQQLIALSSQKIAVADGLIGELAPAAEA